MGHTRPAPPSAHCRVCHGMGETVHGQRCVCTYNRHRAALGTEVHAMAEALRRANPGRARKGESGRERWQAWRASCLTTYQALARRLPTLDAGIFLESCGSPD